MITMFCLILLAVSVVVLLVAGNAPEVARVRIFCGAAALLSAGYLLLSAVNGPALPGPEALKQRFKNYLPTQAVVDGRSSEMTDVELAEWETLDERQKGLELTAEQRERHKFREGSLGSREVILDDVLRGVNDLRVLLANEKREFNFSTGAVAHDSAAIVDMMAEMDRIKENY